MASGSAEESSRWSVRRRLSRASEVEFFWRRGPLNLSRVDGGAGAIARLYAGAETCWRKGRGAGQDEDEDEDATRRSGPNEHFPNKSPVCASGVLRFQASERLRLVERARTMS